MLELLHIENIAVIQEADIQFAPGFNALTGETGAGKSIVIDAMGAVLGGRTSRDLIRTGAARAFVSAQFSGVPADAPRGLPALVLPPGITARPCPEDSWEYTGEIHSNFVSARGRLSSWFQKSSWRPEKRITLDASLKPQVILTFSNREYELTLLLWKIKTDLTGFSYRRDRKPDWKGEIIQ